MNFFRAIQKYKQFSSIWNAIRDQGEQMLIESEVKSWKMEGYLERLLNDMVSNQSVVYTEYERAGPYLEDVSLEEVKTAIFGLKNWKTPGTDEIPAELIRYRGEELHVIIYRLCQQIWINNAYQIGWIRWFSYCCTKKDLKEKFANYREILLLNSAYTVFIQILLNRIVSYTEDYLSDYLCGFWRGWSNTEQLYIIDQIIEKKYEYWPNMWQLFIDFRNTYDSIHIESL